MPFLTAVCIFAEPLIRTWIGEGLVDAATPARLLLLSLIPSFAIIVGQTMLVALGRIGPMIWMVAAWTALNLVLSILLVGPMGVNGPIVATLVCTVLLFFPVTWLFLSEIGVGALEWFKDVILPVVPSFGAQVLVGLFLLPVANRSGSLVVVVFLCAVTICVAIVVWALFGLSSRRRRELVQMLRETVKPSQPKADAGSAGDPSTTEASVRN
jgi:O-antigen/teichoic acid export membrane protein